MDGHGQVKSETAKEVQVPEWEHIAAQQGDGKIERGVGAGHTNVPLKEGATRLLDKVVPPHRTYLGRSRKTFLLVLLVIALAILALIIGLAAGLSHRG